MNQEQSIREARAFVNGSHLGKSTSRELDRAILIIRDLLAVFEEAHAKDLASSSGRVKNPADSSHVAGYSKDFRVAESSPSDDEREALVREVSLAHAEAWSDECECAEAPDRIADAVLAAGFHRTVQGEPTPEVWKTRIEAVRERQIAKGYTPKHDAQHGIRHLLTWAIDYSRRGRAEDASALIYAALELLNAQGEPSNVTEPGVSDISSAQMSQKGEPTDAQVQAALLAWRNEWNTDDEGAMRSALRAAAAGQGGER